MIICSANTCVDSGVINMSEHQVPPLAGVAEAAEILTWDKRRVATYIKRGDFPEPIQRLASGPIWTRKQIEDYREARDGRK